MTAGSRDRPPRRDGRGGGPGAGGDAAAPAGLGRRPGFGAGNHAAPAAPVAAVALGDPDTLERALEGVGARRLVEIVATLPAPAGVDGSAAVGAASLVLAPWPAALEWIAAAPEGAPLGGRLPILLVGGAPARAFLLVEAPGPCLAAALHPAAAGPLVGLAGEVSALRAENRELRDALEARKAIERAKGILMEQEGISEAEAFTRIQRLSMTKRKSMKEISEAIILSREVSGR